jgi:hypothetical protein
MVFHIQPHQGRWLVFRDGVPVFAGDYGQVEDWLDRAENCAGYPTVPETPSSAPGTNATAINEGRSENGNSSFAARDEEKAKRA